MTNAEVIRIAKERVTEMFAKRTTKTGEEFKITVTKARHNGAHVNVKAIIPAHDSRPAEQWTVGYGCTVYAIAGRENIVKRINEAYIANI